MITGAFFSQATGLIKRMVKHLKYFNPAMGAMLIILGILVFTNQLNLLTFLYLKRSLIYSEDFELYCDK
jgi:cytochrome c-type biogenesis protein